MLITVVSLNVCEREIEEMVSGEGVWVRVFGECEAVGRAVRVNGEGLEVRR